ncbi:MAG: hypothetical protein Q4C49_11325 [Bacillota bacterium]|nr:hypothetical protein [Bacillota bacterium]
MENNNIPPILNVEQGDKKSYKTILAIVSILLGIISYFLRGFAVYQILFAFVVLFLSAVSVVCAVLAYKKETLISIIALVISISSCGSAISLLSSFLAEALFVPDTIEDYLYEDYFTDDYDYPIYFDNGGNESDYFWD